MVTGERMRFVFDITCAFRQMIYCCMVLGEVVSIIFDSLLPVNVKLLLGLLISEPIIPHVPRFRAFLVNVVVYKSCCGRVICLDGGGRLGMIQTF